MYYYCISKCTMSFLPQTKFGDCSRCPEKDTACKKRGKDLVCLNCCNIEDTGKQTSKANERNKLRGLMNKQVQSGNYDDASKQALMNDCDYCFSRIVRLRAADEHGNCDCFTCDKGKKHWSLMQCGHYIKRGNKSLRFNFRNSRVQCKHCNETLGGNYEVYRIRLEEEEPGITEQLEAEGREIYTYSVEELKMLLHDLRGKLRLLETKK